MRYLRSILIPALVSGSVVANAQDLREAYNMSNTTVQGTARSMGFGNALGSVGGDFSSLSVNPAGLGVYRSSELTFTPSLRINATSSQYLGNSTDDNNTRFNVNNFGLVFTSAPKGKRYDHRNWKAVSFALGMNRVADFNYNYNYSGTNASSSGSQVFASDANYNKAGAGADPQTGYTLGFMGYQSYLLNKDAAGNYYSIVPVAGGVSQARTVQERGGINEYTISLGGNYKERLMLGATIGIPSLNYVRDVSYTETLAPNNNVANPYGFSYFNYSQHIEATGGGINAKIGAIYKINDMFRIGAAFHSPTYYSVSEFSSPSLTAVHNDSMAVVADDGYNYRLNNHFDYTFTTPWKGVLSATMLINKIGFITADYEYVGYNSMRYQFGGDYFNNYQAEQDAINQEIKKVYQGASNFRLGGEVRLNKYFMARAGFGYYGNAYTDYGQSVANSYYTTERIDLSAGIGFRFDHFFTDLGYVHSMYQGYEQPYSIAGTTASIPGAKVDFGINNVALTIGVKF